MMAFGSLLDWALRYTRDYVGRARDGLDEDVLDSSRLSGTFTRDVPYHCYRVSFLLVPYMHTDAVHDAFAAPGPSCCTFCEKCGVLLGIFDLFVVDLRPEIATVPKCNCGMTQFFQTTSWWTEAGASDLPICEGCNCPRTCSQDHQGCY